VSSRRATAPVCTSRSRRGRAGHGGTASELCMELAAFTPMAPGTKVRFCFRGHAHSARRAGTPVRRLRRRPRRGRERLRRDARGRHVARPGRDHAPPRPRPRAVRAHRVRDAGRARRQLSDHARFDHVAELLETLPVDEAVRRSSPTPSASPSTTRSRGSVSSTYSCGRTSMRWGRTSIATIARHRDRPELLRAVTAPT
jgi:hypothetical protein